jgi:hypothetical protein
MADETPSVPEVRVRAAEPEDAAAMASVYVAAAREAWGPIFGANNLLALKPPNGVRVTLGLDLRSAGLVR